MGTPVEPGEKGVDCPIATPLLWAAGQTPKYLMVMFTGIIKCPGAPAHAPDPPNGPWILTQDPVNPCIWANFTGFWIVRYTIQAIQTRLELSNGGAGNIFHALISEPAWAHFDNDLHCQPLAWLAEGSGFVDLFDFPGTAHQLLHDYGLAPIDYTKFDVFGCEGEPPYVQVRRFGNVRTPTNVKIKTDDTHKDQYETFEK